MNVILTSRVFIHSHTAALIPRKRYRGETKNNQPAKQKTHTPQQQKSNASFKSSLMNSEI